MADSPFGFFSATTVDITDKTQKLCYVRVFTDNDDKKDLSSVYFFHYRIQYSKTLSMPSKYLVS